jgi:hypothetical protein
MTDLSRTGARLVATNEPRLNPTPKFMGLQFQLPGRPEILVASGEAVSQAVSSGGGHVVGIRFTRLTPAAASAIDALVQLA